MPASSSSTSILQFSADDLLVFTDGHLVGQPETACTRPAAWLRRWWAGVVGPARQAGVMALLAGEGGPRRVGRRSAAEQQVAPAVDAPDPPPYAHLRRATALAPGGAVFVSQDIVVLPSRSQGACHASPHWRRLIVDTIHLAASVVLSSALPIAVRGFWQWCKQRQAQQATDRLLQARPGCTAVTLQDNGAIRIEWSPDDPAGVRPLQGVPPHLLEQSITLTRVDRPVSADASRHDSAGLAPKPQLKGKGRARRKRGRARHRR
jgi:hypothetical protein